MQQNVGIADQQKAGTQGSDDSIKQFSTQLPLYHGAWADERCRLSVHRSYTLWYINIPWVVVNYIK